MTIDVIFDLDGTLYDIRHRLHLIQGETKDWDAFHKAWEGDEPIIPTINIAQTLQQGYQYQLIFCTARSEEWRKETVNQLSLNFGPTFLYMREAGDHRPDHEVKQDLLAQMRADGLNPTMAFEDRKQVADMWLANGLICAHIAEGDY